MRLWGINAHFLPYIPPQQTRDYLLAIRKERDQRIQPTKRILMAGSALNVPTAQGMQQLMDYWQHISGYELRVAGYGTLDKLLHPQKGYVTLLGTLSDEQMREEMISCDALLISQPPTTGALTRIQEALVAGIPIIANDNAVRTYRRTAGVYEYTHMEDLNIILQQDLLVPLLPNMDAMEALKL